MSISILTYADIIDKQLEIIYHPYQESRFTAQFLHGEIIENGKEGILQGMYGNGKTPNEAIYNYCKRIVGQVFEI